MENDNNRNDALHGADTNNDWQLAKNLGNTENDFSDDADLKAAEAADGYETEETYEPFSAAERDDDDPEDDDDDDNEEEESGDWGTVDPIKERDGFPDPMDPSGPGSAV